jgi:ABC transporter substrate binding protein (PQQ-dependent alcohol dehydrogenase system)
MQSISALARLGGVAALAACTLVHAAPAAEPLVIGHLSLAGDARYVQDWGYARLIVPPPIETEQAAQMAIDDLAFVSEAAGIAPRLATAEAKDLAGLPAALEGLIAEGAAHVILDLPAEGVEAVAAATEGREVLLFNATAPQDALRTACHANLLHSFPSRRMEMDTYAQYLRAMNWTRILVLEGQQADDGEKADAFVASAERLRLEIADRRVFTLAANPEQREGNNVKLLTGGVDYDVVFVADTRGEFGRFIPYGTQLPRPVIGSAGLSALAWHWAMERDGATQVSSRFDRMADGRKMSSQDWSAWIAVKSIVTGLTKRPGATPSELRDYLKSHRLRLDGSKGVTLGYRAWDGQMRMPMLLATSDAVIAVAPIEGFMHATNTLDTLGTDEAEFACD